MHVTGKLIGALRSLCAALAFMTAASAAHAIQVTYDFVNVGYALGGGDSATLTGGESLLPISSNLPVAFTGGSTTYRFGAAADPGSVSTVNWTWTNGTDSLFGTSQTKTEVFGFNGTPFARYTGIRTVDGGTGYFAGATGSGTNEFYANYMDSAPGTFSYQGINIERWSVTLQTDTPIVQTDTRPASVLVKSGVENLQTGVGSNSGIITSQNAGATLLETETSDYTFLPLPIAGPPFVGTFKDFGPDGTLEGTSDGPTIVYGHLGTIFNYAPGTAQFTGGTGAFSGVTGSSAYEAISIGTGGPIDAQTYAVIVVSRVNPVPEPSEWALLLAGLSLLGCVVRRRNRG